MMRTESFSFPAADGTALPAVLHLPEGNVRAVLQITHGMTEHIGRYTALAEELSAHGIAAGGFDLRGHGSHPGDPACASFGEAGWDASLDDMHRFGELLDRKFPGVPRFLFGFSLGSFLLREYLNRYNDSHAGAVIAGTGHQPGAVLSVMTAIVKTQVKKAGFDRTTPLVRKLSFETYNQKFAPNRTPSDWLCADHAELDAYRADPLCRADISAGLFLQLLEAMKRTGGRSAYNGWNRERPVLLLAGGDDPVGNAGQGVIQVQKAMTAAGIRDVTLQLFPGARHDLFHEETSGCAAKARAVLTEWILANLPEK